MDNSQINEFFDLAAYEQQAQQLLKACETTARQLKENFTKVSGGLGAEALTAYRDGVEKVSKTAATAKAAVSEYSKAIEKHNKVLNEQKVTDDQITQALELEANTIAELTAKNRVLESVRKNLNINDAKYAETQKKLIDAQNKNIEKIKEFQNVEQKRVSGIGKYEEAIRNALHGEGNYRTQLMNLRNTMADLEQEIGRATSEFGAQSPQVVELQKRYDELQKKAGQLTDAQGDMQARIKYLADDYGKFKATLQGLQAAMGIVSVFQGFTALLGIHNENLDKVVKNMTALIAVMKGLQEVQNLLNKDNYFIQMIKNTPALNKVLATIKGGIESIGLSVKSALGIIGAAAAAITTIIVVMKKLNDKQEEAAKKTAEAAKRQAEYNYHLQETFHQIDTSGVKTLINLNTQWKSLGNNLKEKEKFINDNKTAFQNLGLKIDSVTDAEKRLSDEGLKSYIKYMVGKNKVDILAQQIAQKEIDLAKRQAQVTAAIKDNGIFSPAGMFAAGGQGFLLAKKELDDLYDLLGNSQKEAAKYEEAAGIIQQSNKNNDKSFKKTNEEVEESINQFEQLIEVLKVGFSERDRSNLITYYENLNTLRGYLYNGQITMEEFEEAAAKLNYEFQRMNLQNQIEDLQELANIGEMSEESSKKLQDLQQKLADLDFSRFVENSKKANNEVKDDAEQTSKEVKRSWDEQLSDITDVFGSFADTLASISQSMYDSQIDGLNRLSERQNLNYEQQRNIIENTITDETEKEKALRKLDTQRVKSQSEIAKQQAEIERRKAKFDIAITTATALATAAGAIADAIKSASSQGDPYTIAARVAAAVAAVVAGIASVTAAIAKVGNIPAYAAGGLSPKDAPFRAGEKGYEIGIGQRTGKPYMFANDAVYMTPERVNIMPHDKSVAATTTINNNKNVRLRNEVVVKVVNQSRVEKYFNLN